MDHSSNGNHWRQMFDNGRRGGPSAPQVRGPASPAPFGYDDGYDPAREAGPTHPQEPLSSEDITDEAAMALALDATEYRPWILQRGRSRPAMMLHLRRYDSKTAQWMGWQVAYSHLAAIEYVGSKLVSLDFGARQFVIEGSGLDELARHLQTGSVLMMQEYAAGLCGQGSAGARIDAIRCTE